MEVLDEDPTAVGPHRTPRVPGPSHDDEPAPHGTGTGGPDLRHVLRRWWPLPVVLALSVAVVSVVGVQRDRERSERLAAVPGVVRPLDGPPEVLWRTPAVTGDQVLVAGGRVVVVQPGSTTWRATARDPRTGAVRWTAEVAPAAGAAMEAGAVRCPDPGVDVGAVLVCLASEPSPVYADDPDGSVTSGQVAGLLGLAPPRMHVVALSSRDGRTLGSWMLDGELVASSRVEDDVVVATVDADGHVVVERRDAASGAVAWTYRSPEPVRGQIAQALTTVEVTRELVLVAGSATRVLDSSHGFELTTAPEFRFMRVQPMREGFGTWSPVDGGALHDATGAVTAAVPGLPAPLRVDDGSEPGVVVLDVGTGVAAYDARTGEERWRTTTALDPQLLVDHRLVVAGGSRYGVLDARTGEEVWDAELGAPLPWLPVTDGALVLGPAVGPDGGAQLVGRGLPDGVRYWSVDVPEGTRRVWAVAGHLLLSTTDEHRVLG